MERMNQIDNKLSNSYFLYTFFFKFKNYLMKTLCNHSITKPIDSDKCLNDLSAIQLTTFPSIV